MRPLLRPDTITARIIQPLMQTTPQTFQPSVHKAVFSAQKDSVIAFCATCQQTELIFDELTRVNLKRRLVTYLALHLVSTDTRKHYIMYLEVYYAELNRSTQHPPTA